MLKRVVWKYSTAGMGLLNMQFLMQKHFKQNIFVYRNGLELVFIGSENYLRQLEEVLRSETCDYAQEFHISDLYK